MAKRVSNTNAGPHIAAREPFKGSNMEGVKGAPSSHGWLNQTQFSKQLADVANTTDYHVKSYNTPIAVHHEGGWIYPDVSHSPSTAKHQSIVRRAIGVKSERDKKMEARSAKRAAKQKAASDQQELNLWNS
jgi:cell division protein YceG involved in septum cleavage